MPRVSVVLTSYNHEKYIREAIDSVLAQTFTDFELIIWDDASGDSSWDVIRSYADSRIKAFRNPENLGPVYGINKAISEIAAGDYIAIHHSDDTWVADKLEKQVSFLALHPELGAVFSDANAMGETGQPLLDANHFYLNIFTQPNRTREEWLHYFFYSGNALCHPSVLIKKQCYMDCGLYSPYLAQVPDFEMWIRLCLAHNIHVMPEKLVNFRVRAGEANTSGNRPETRVRGATELRQLLNHYLKLEDYDSVLKVFPEAFQYASSDGCVPGFLIAMVALNSDTSVITKQFAMDVLYGLLADPKKAAELKQLYNFDYREMIAITARHDVFALDARAERDKALADLDNIMRSKSWRITRPLRQISEFKRNRL